MIGTGIEWADDTVNPWIGCQRISPACEHCYAEAYDARFRVGGETHWGPSADRYIRVEKAIGELWRIARKGAKPWDLCPACKGHGLSTGDFACQHPGCDHGLIARPRRVFIASLSDFFEDRPELVEPRLAVWAVLHHLSTLTPAPLIPMILTKRPDVMVRWASVYGWPAHAWAGVTVEDQQRADERIPHLLRVPAPVRFLSCEPLLGPVDLEPWLWDGPEYVDNYVALPSAPRTDGIAWCITGGESGHHARPTHPDWFRSLRDQCQAAAVPYLHKQNGEWAQGEDVEANGTDWVGMYEADPRDGGVPQHSWPDAPVRETARRLGKGEIAGPISVDTTVLRVGRARAGRLLDGREWNEIPEVTRG